MKDSELNRRPIATRDAGWAQAMAAWLARTTVTPNQISTLSIVFAGIGAALLVWWPTPWGLLLCAFCIQLRLLCNLLDGLVAVEGGKGSALGKIYNEFPDRVTDSLLLIAMGYACGAPWLGWLCALLAVLTRVRAYLWRLARLRPGFPRATGQGTAHGSAHVRLRHRRGGNVLP